MLDLHNISHNWYTPANKVWGYVYRNHPVCLFTSCPHMSDLGTVLFHSIVVHDRRHCVPRAPVHEVSLRIYLLAYCLNPHNTMHSTQFCRLVYMSQWQNRVKCIVLYGFKVNNRWAGKDVTKPRALELLGHRGRVCCDFDSRSLSSRSLCTYTQNLCPGHNCSLLSWIWIIFYTIIVHNPRMCHDLDPGSYFQAPGHIYHKSVCGPRLLTVKLDLDISYNCCPWPKGRSCPWPKVISPRSRSQCTYRYTS